MFISAEDLLGELRDALQRSTGTDNDLKPFWHSIVTAANIQAYWEIIGSLMYRGWSKAKIDQWDRGAEYQRSIGLWICLEHGLAMESQSINEAALEEYRLDRRWELKDTDKGPGVLLTIGGAFQKPDTTLGQPTVGPMDTSGDLFVLDPADSAPGTSYEALRAMAKVIADLPGLDEKLGF